ncbi:hypothetical protein PTTG_26618 [Puccinia triticina 1-1 BBBD Race 1]|uniref:BTB domain-containing protein n=1 Tax=Puccinia triticina (isolate 1-1 / race 1 (BBBD)) TaxID=630390 RepID=A0A180GTF7_PUCT1|nr:hypothetical protein PTTG_26618 [Puccinia triticina 1-1 BBBD Race 1]
MVHASPFFESILNGEWAETTELLSPASSPSSPQLIPEERSPSPTNDQHILPTNDDASTALNISMLDHHAMAPERSQALPDPQPLISNLSRIEARILLKDERPASFQDLLMFVYPHLECVCTWHNASDLMTMSQKFDMPLLQRHVLNFLLSSVAGKPIEAMKIAEEHQLSELYRESSRFLLDNWQGWDHKELERLSSQTLLKLEKRRTWFLERLLKLGLVNSSRDYVCPPTCPDPHHCTKLVDDKWRSAWAASFKFGPPQPSSVYRALRCLEPSLHSPALLLPHTSCQQHALRFFADLFDRMFSQFTPRGPGGAGVGTSGGGSGTVGGVSVSHSASASSAAAAAANPLIPLLGETNHHHQLGTGAPSVFPPVIPPSLPTQLPSTALPSSTTTNTTTVTTNPTPITHPANPGTLNPATSAATPFPPFSSLTLATSSSSSNLLINSDKTFRKAKYFLHVELFDSVDKNPRKRVD